MPCSQLHKNTLKLGSLCSVLIAVTDCKTRKNHTVSCVHVEWYNTNNYQTSLHSKCHLSNVSFTIHYITWTSLSQVTNRLLIRVDMATSMWYTQLQAEHTCALFSKPMIRFNLAFYTLVSVTCSNTNLRKYNHGLSKASLTITNFDLHKTYAYHHAST